MAGAYQPLLWLAIVERELLLFAAFWFALGALDELAIDVCYGWLRLTGRARTPTIDAAASSGPLSGPLAVLVPAWHEAAVIGAMAAHALKAWPQADLRLYVGCYRNDAATLAAAAALAGHDPRLRLVIHDCAGPTTKADCLNRLYRALGADETRERRRFAGIVLHDAEDMVHPAALGAIDRALAAADFVQLPVRPEPQKGSRWIAGHYADEFAEAHTKALVVRDALGAGIPAAGVGCGFARDALAQIAAQHGGNPFATDCLVEDYELGLSISENGGRSRFLRLRNETGALVATRSFFPAELATAVRQKTRWIHGIALQEWDRMGWTAHPLDCWMRLRDRRGPMTALVLSAAYLLVLVETALQLASWLGLYHAPPTSPLMQILVGICLASLIWRTVIRCAIVTREYGLGEGLRSALRIPVANIIAIMAGRRALAAYWRSLRGESVVWDKTEHLALPALSPVGYAR